VKAALLVTAIAGWLWLGGCTGSDNGGTAGVGSMMPGPISGSGSGSGAAVGASDANGTTSGTAAPSAGMSAAGTGAGGAAGLIAAGMGASGASASGTSAAGAGAGGTNAAGTGAGAAGAGGNSSAGMAAAGMSGAAGSGGAALTLTSSAFTAGSKLPKKYRCVMLGGMSGPSPALTWSGGPTALSYAVTLTDLTNNIAHWTLYDIPPATMMLPEGLPLGATLTMPAGAKQSSNQLTQMTGPGYFGPCGGATAGMYEYELYALDVATLPGVTASSTYSQVRMAIKTHTLAMGTAKLGVTSSSMDP
jgi:phosphatidylethanolamine-binding protein (PEBP) family uncharacterized protein